MSIEVSSQRGATKVITISTNAGYTASKGLPELFERVAQMMRGGEIPLERVTAITIYQACVYDSTEWAVDVFVDVSTRSGDFHEWWRENWPTMQQGGALSDRIFAAYSAALAAWRETNQRRDAAALKDSSEPVSGPTADDTDGGGHPLDGGD